MHDGWSLLVEVLVLLSAALLAGTAAEQMRQSAIIGYLLAGMAVGPFGMKAVSADNVAVLGELGAGVLLFVIGLEFSLPRLREMGRTALLGGVWQVLLTATIGAFAAAALGVPWRGAFIIGAMLAMSSTAVVTRVLLDQGKFDSVHGRHAVGVLLTQDVCVVPLMLVAAVVCGEGDWKAAAWTVGRTSLGAVVLAGLFVMVFRNAAPAALNLRSWVRNRDLPGLLAVIVPLAAAWAAHRAGLSPAMGAFVAGVLLGESPFAVQLRADVSSLRATLVTLFFASVGMYGDPLWIVQHAGLVLGLSALVIAFKAGVVWGVLRLLGVANRQAGAAGLCLGQIGEFAFVLATLAYPKWIDEYTFRALVGATIVTFAVTPALAAVAGRLAGARAPSVPSPQGAGANPEAMEKDDADAPDASHGPHASSKDFLVVGFGPAGQCVALAMLKDSKHRMLVIDLNRDNLAEAHRYGLAGQYGDAQHEDVLRHACVEARVVVITVPDPDAVRQIISQCRAVWPKCIILARARYHTVRWELVMAGADEVFDEEEHVGLALAGLARVQMALAKSG